MISHHLKASVLAFFCATATISAAAARTVYDGPWSVLIVTEKGSCDRAYRYGVQIVDGNVRYDGGGPINLSGHVMKNGNVQVIRFVRRQSGRWRGTSLQKHRSRELDRRIWLRPLHRLLASRAPRLALLDQSQ